MKKQLEVHKIGGVCLGSAQEFIDAAALMVEVKKDTPLIVVVSAMAGVTDDLDRAAKAAEHRDRERALRLADGVISRHEKAARLIGQDDNSSQLAEIGKLRKELFDLIEAVVLLRQLSASTRDRILAIGEKLSARLLAWAFDRFRIKCRFLDADGFLETDGRHGEASPLMEVADRTIKGVVGPVLESQEVPVVTGFCGRGPDGATTTLGRGGADLTASFVASAMGADAVIIWTDVEGVHTANPKTVPEARVIPRLNYREAAELSFYGAKLLHPRSMIPVGPKRIPVYIRNAKEPKARGTVVDSSFTPGSHPVKGISAILNQSLVSVEGKGMAGLSGVAERVFGALARERISVTMISQSSSESTICLAVPGEQAATAECALRRELRDDLGTGQVEEIMVRRRVGLVAAVGLGMANTPGVAARVFYPLGKAKINVLAISQGSSELSISLAVDDNDVDQTVKIMHDEFGLGRLDTGEDDSRRLDLILLGFGKIGQRLVQLILERHAPTFGRLGLSPRIVAVTDRSGYLLEPKGISNDWIRLVIEAKQAQGGISSLSDACSGTATEMVREALSYRLARPILVDVTDVDEAEEIYDLVFQLGCDVVTTNKKPLAGNFQDFQKILDRADSCGRLLKAEATVGAGLPVMDTMDMLLATGDSLRFVEGCLSGTLGFIMSRLEAGAVFSSTVQEAVRLGYAEPDPIADLTGTDVARKALILGRLSGLVKADCEVKLEGLVDPALSRKKPQDLMKELQSYDSDMKNRVENARQQAMALRYIAKVRPNVIEIGPMLVSKDSVFGHLSGTDNMIVFKSERYQDHPLVITGPGAGVGVTAMGVMSDILRIAASRR